MCDRKYMFGLHLVQARMVKTCPKKFNTYIQFDVVASYIQI